LSATIKAGSGQPELSSSTPALQSTVSHHANRAMAGKKSVKRDPEKTRALLLVAAMKEFSSKGFSGARIDKIVNRSKCNVRMIYYYFGSKEGLYRAVLEWSYARIRSQESKLHLERLPPLEGMIRLLDNTFDHFDNNPDFVALLNNENLMRGRFVLRLRKVREMTSPLRHALEDLIERGEREKIFRKGIDPIQIYATVAAMGWFHLSNAYTLSAMFGCDLTAPAWKKARRAHVREVIMAYLTNAPTSALHSQRASK
jgi:AcrR family transcriptional regulator